MHLPVYLPVVELDKTYQVKFLIYLRNLYKRYKSMRNRTI